MSNEPIMKSYLSQQYSNSTNRWSNRKSAYCLRSEIPLLSRNRSADQLLKKRMESECKLHTLHLTDKWTSTGHLKYSGTEGINIKQKEVVLEPPDQIHSKLGLSGSKVRKNSVSYKSGYLNHKNIVSTESNTDVSTPVMSDRSQSQMYSSRTYKNAANGEEADKQLRHLRWNSSDQGMRLQREISYINLSRNAKRASEVVSYRVDPMYMMSGFKIDLQNRYSIKEGEIKKLQEMEHLRETFSSNLKTLKSHHPSSSSSNKLVKTKHSSLADKNLSQVKSKDVNVQQSGSNEQIIGDNQRQTTESAQQLKEDTKEQQYENNFDQHPDNTEEENNEQHIVE